MNVEVAVSDASSTNLAFFRKGAEEAAAAEQAIQREIDKKEKPNEDRKDGGAMQAGARTYPEPPLPAQHLGKPGEEAALAIQASAARSPSSSPVREPTLRSPTLPKTLMPKTLSVPLRKRGGVAFCCQAMLPIQNSAKKP
jgi:hypothetical protein